VLKIREAALFTRRVRIVAKKWPSLQHKGNSKNAKRKSLGHSNEIGKNAATVQSKDSVGKKKKVPEKETWGMTIPLKNRGGRLAGVNKTPGKN